MRMEDYWSDIHSQADSWTPLSASALRVYRLIRKRLAIGELKPGDRILEIEVARAAGVSRSPVREAFERLEIDGLVASKPRRGTYVMPLGTQRFKEVAEFRLELEEIAVRRLATHGLAEDLHDLRLRLVIAPEDPALNIEAFVRADTAFHCTLVEHAGSEPLLGAYMWLAKEFSSYSRLGVGDVDMIHQLEREHDELIDLICKRETERAIDVLRAHLLRGFDRTVSRLS
jgi:DNA-binding GntR family transcriptional regulator